MKIANRCNKIKIVLLLILLLITSCGKDAEIDTPAESESLTEDDLDERLFWQPGARALIWGIQMEVSRQRDAYQQEMNDLARELENNEERRYELIREGLENHHASWPDDLEGRIAYANIRSDEEEDEETRIANCQVRTYTLDVCWGEFQHNPVEEYATVLPVEERDYYCPHGEQIYHLVSGIFVLNGESEAIQKINAQIAAERDAFLVSYLEAAEATVNWTEESCGEAGFLVSESHIAPKTVRFWASGIYYIDENYIEISYCPYEYDYWGKIDHATMEGWAYTKVYSLETGEEIGICQLLDVTEEEWIDIINKEFLRFNGFDTLPDGKTAGELWVENPDYVTWMITTSEDIEIDFSLALFPGYEYVKEVDFAVGFVGILYHPDPPLS